MPKLKKVGRNTLTKIWEIAVPPSGTGMFATAQTDGLVSVWSTRKRTKLCEFDTAFSLGGKRLAFIEKPEPLVIVGAWARHGLCVYNAQTGELIWQRKKLTNVQVAQSFPTAMGQARIGLTCEKRPFLILDIDSGEEMARFSKVEGITVSSTGSHVAYMKHDSAAFGEVGKPMQWEKFFPSFVYRIAINEDGLIVHSAPGSVVDIVTGLAKTEFGDGNNEDNPYPPGITALDFEGNLLWNLPEQVEDLAWCPKLRSWGLVANAPEEKGHDLLVVNRKGKPTHRKHLGWATNSRFSSNGLHLITTMAQVLEIPTLDVVWQFDDSPLRES